MKTFHVIGIFLLLGAAAFAQAPHLAYVYPAGGKAGTTFQAVIGGQFLMSVSNAYVSGSGITVTVLDHNRPMGQNEFNMLRDRLKVLQEKFQASRKRDPGTNIWTEADTKEREEIRAKILKNPPNRTANMAMIDNVTVRIEIATNVAVGDREIRLATPNALSNPMKFCVGDLPEVTKLAAKAANPDLDKYIEKLGGRPAPVGTPKYDAHLTLPATINGQIMPGGVDRYRFTATRGQQLIIAASARSLIPYLADAVPGWFELTLTIFDAKGKELASAERFHFKPDPVLRFEVPRDGEYTMEIHDSIFRGREDFVYRITMGELPYVTAIYPLGGKVGQKTFVTLTGWNLPVKNLKVDCADVDPGVISVRENFFNPVPFAVDTLPEVSASYENHSVETAQSVTLPVIINGRVRQANEAEIFKFEGHAGQSIVAEVLARRLDSPLDSLLRLTDKAGQQIAFNDDFEDKGTGLNTHHADSYLTATLPADGTYFIHLTDTQGQGGPEFAYRLRISEPQPDFALRIVPSSLSLRAGLSAPVTVFALRRDGFTNAIDLDLKDAPFGFTLSGAKISAGQDKAQFTLKAPPEPTKKPVAITVAGHAMIGGKLVVHDAAPAEDMMQAFFYRHLVPSQELAATVNGQQKAFLRDSFKIISATPVKIPSGGTVRVKVSMPLGGFSDRFKLELNNAPEGILLASVTNSSGGLELVFSADADKVKPGVTGNLICDVLPVNQFPKVKQKKSPKSVRGAVATLPAIPFQITMK